MRKLLAGLIAAAALLAPQMAQASNCYIREYQNIAQIGTQPAQIAPEAGTAIDQTPVAIGAAASSAAFNAHTNFVRLICGASVSYTFSSSATPSATTSNSVLPALLPEYFAVVPGQYVSFISNAEPMKRSIAAFLVLLALAGAAHAFGLGLGNRFGKLGAISGAGSGGGGGGCTGTIDLSKGCAMPMLGGL